MSTVRKRLGLGLALGAGGAKGNFVRGQKRGGPFQRTAEKVSHLSLTSPEKDAIEMIVQGKIAGIEY